MKIIIDFAHPDPNLLEEWDRSPEARRVLALARTAWADFLRRREAEAIGDAPEGTDAHPPPMRNGHNHA